LKKIEAVLLPQTVVKNTKIKNKKHNQYIYSSAWILKSVTVTCPFEINPFNMEHI